jgi:hypothetical protein
VIFPLILAVVGAGPSSFLQELIPATMTINPIRNSDFLKRNMFIIINSFTDANLDTKRTINYPARAGVTEMTLI